MADQNIGRSVNVNKVTRTVKITVGNTPVIIAPENLKRTSFLVVINGDSNFVVSYVRYYPAAQDGIDHGRPLYKNFAGNDNLFRIEDLMDSDNIYTGEISAKVDAGCPEVTVDMYITEY